jgi:hypothetical protein
MKKNEKELTFGVWKFGAPSSKLWLAQVKKGEKYHIN